MASRYKAKAGELRQIVDSFRAYRTPGARATEVESRAAAAAEAAAVSENMLLDDMDRSEMLDGKVGASSVGRIGYKMK